MFIHHSLVSWFKVSVSGTLINPSHSASTQQTRRQDHSQMSSPKFYTRGILREQLRPSIGLFSIPNFHVEAKDIYLSVYLSSNHCKQ